MSAIVGVSPKKLDPIPMATECIAHIRYNLRMFVFGSLHRDTIIVVLSTIAKHSHS